MSKVYDLILFGVTGFTGKLAAEYLIEKNYDIRWAVCARNQEKAKAALMELSRDRNSDNSIDVIQADTVCETEEQLKTLREIVAQTKAVATCVGPFELYGKHLIKLCAEEGVHYADITGETDFVRHAITEYDAAAREKNACIIPHCGNDCIPQDMLVHELHRKAVEMGSTLEKVETFVEFPGSASASGGTAATAAYQLNKDRAKIGAKSDFDPLLKLSDDTKSRYITQNISPKSTTHSKTIQQKVAPWIMAPVMVNCVRRSNALLGYCETLQYGDSKIENSTGIEWVQENFTKATLAAGISIPFLRPLLPQSGQGPERATMEEGYLIVTGVARLKGNSKKLLRGKFHFKKDVGYLYTAALLVETCMVILKKEDKTAGVVTPAVGLGHDLTERILETMDVTLDIETV